jgi:hypothetical protein
MSPVINAQFIGNWLENRRGAQNTFIFLTIRQNNGAPTHPAPIGMADRTRKKSAKHFIGAQCLVIIAY